jgi:hypothetical protein
MGAPDILQNIEPGPSRQRQIQDNQIPRLVANRPQGFRSIARFGNLAARKGFRQHFDDTSSH